MVTGDVVTADGPRLPKTSFDMFKTYRVRVRSLGSQVDKSSLRKKIMISHHLEEEEEGGASHMTQAG